MRVKRASTTTKKKEKEKKGRFQTLGHIGLKKFFSKYGHAVYCWKALGELNNFYKKTIGQI